jgi:hypothetical protein
VGLIKAALALKDAAGDAVGERHSVTGASVVDGRSWMIFKVQATREQEPRTTIQ